ncbi:hypothetical protein ABIB40_003567 [Pedobacter sp. UYP30]|uniref:hypothetical protein n=1 Tax=Pedobacter sp. UYP30 TaxID=1756400 RepID=UPI00339B96C8
MKRAILILISILGVFRCFGQRELSISVRNKENKRIPYALVILKNAEFAFNTDKKGNSVFFLKDSQIDTLLVKAQGFEDLTVSIPKEGKDLIINLTEETHPNLKAARRNSAKVKPSELNGIDKDSVFYFIGLGKRYENPNYLQYAQKFVIEKAGSALTSVTVNRLVLFLRNDGFDADLKRAMFRIRLYTLDSLSDTPGKEFCNEVIQVVDTVQKVVKIDLSKYKITIPTAAFFVAIEVLRIPYNEQLVLLNKHGIAYDAPPHTLDRGNIFQPFIGLLPRGKQNGAWVLTIKNEWKQYKYFPDKSTNFAISATVVP